MRFLYIIFFFGLCFNFYGQELPPIINYSAKDYKAGNQNWMITQDENHHIYVANNSGLLSFNGEQWKLNQLPDGSFLRSVKYIDKKIFSGSYMDFGYWEEDEKGELNYTSLNELVDSPFLDGEQFWHIETVANYVVFQSLRRLYSYNLNTGKVVVIPSEYTITNLFKLHQKLYYQVAEKGLYEISSDEPKIIVPYAELKNQLIVDYFEYKSEKYIVTRNQGIYLVKDSTLVANHPLAIKQLEGESIFVAKLINKNILALGTIGDGLKLFNLENGSLTHIKQPSLLNNTVLSLFSDDDGNLWTGLDNGISIVNLNSSVKIFTDTFGDIGTVYCSYQEGEWLYLGTNQGLYVRKGNEEDFTLVPNTSGQVWSIQKVKGDLLIGHDKGTFLLKNPNQVEQVYSLSGTWQIKEFNDGFLQGHYNGLSFSKDGKDFKLLNNYDLSSRNIVIDKNKNVWIGHDHKGVYKTKVDTLTGEVTVLNNYSFTNEGAALTVFIFDDQLYVSTAKNIYEYSAEKDEFVLAEKFNKLFKNENRITGISKKIGNSWWAFGEEYLFQITKDAFQDELKIEKIPIPINLRGISTGFENISYLDENTYLVGSNFGYVTFKIPFNKLILSDLKINSVSFSGKGNNYKRLSLENDGIELPYKNNYINFSFSVPQYDLINDIKYSYRLKGYNNTWSAWNTSGKANFENLPFGEYTLEVKGKLKEDESNVEKYSFEVLKPWYLSTAAIVIYVIFLLILFFLTHRVYTNYYKKQQEKLIQKNKKKLEMQELAAQQEIVTLQNKQLETEVESKNRELAASTMNIIKKNEFLSELKNKLSNSESKRDIQEVIKIINRNIAEKDNWKLFKEAFDNADKDFLQSVKEKHPTLTSNDLKLCAYLRLNLSSKEIAPLLNISVRSVEIKRYRLRKKMELDHEQGLVEYILTF